MMSIDEAWDLLAEDEKIEAMAQHWRDGVPADYDRLAYDAGLLDDDEYEPTLLITD